MARSTPLYIIGGIAAVFADIIVFSLKETQAHVLNYTKKRRGRT